MTGSVAAVSAVGRSLLLRLVSSYVRLAHVAQFPDATPRSQGPVCTRYGYVVQSFELLRVLERSCICKKLQACAACGMLLCYPSQALPPNVS
jgi:hypothetical protein